MKSVLITFCDPDEFETVLSMSSLSKVMFESCTVIVEPVSSDPFINVVVYSLIHNLVDNSVLLEKIE